MKQWRRAIYTMQAIDGIAGSLMGVFVPIYYLSLGYSVAQIFTYFIVVYLTVLVMFFVAAKFSQRFGFVKSLFVHLVFLFAALALMYNLHAWPGTLHLAAFFFGCDIAFYWFPVNVIFAKAADSEQMGKQVANLFALPSLVVLFVPLLGAGITALFGFQVLLLVASVIYTFSIIPLLLIGNIPVDVRIDTKKILDYSCRYKKYFGAEVLINAASEVEAYILPIFVYLTFKNILSIGAIAAFLGLGSAIFTLFVGRYADKANKTKILRIGAVALVLIWLARYFAVTEIQFYILSVLAGFFGVLINVPFTSIVFQNAKDNHVEDFTIFREIPVTVGRLLIYGLGILVVSAVKWTFLAAAGSYLLMLLF